VVLAARKFILGEPMKPATNRLSGCSYSASGDKVTLGVRPEHFEIAGADEHNSIDTHVTFVESLGSTTHAYCEYPGAAETLVCELAGHVRPRSGAALTLGIPPGRTYLFDAAGQAFRRTAVEPVQEAA
jgi:multiple sugar transport system ATP-binding protein